MKDATLIPINEPIGLNDWERFNLLVALSFEPKERMKGLAVVSRKARPKVRTYKETQKNENCWNWAAGMNRKAPIAYRAKPSSIPLL